MLPINFDAMDIMTKKEIDYYLEKEDSFTDVKKKKEFQDFVRKRYQEMSNHLESIEDLKAFRAQYRAHFYEDRFFVLPDDIDTLFPS